MRASSHDTPRIRSQFGDDPDYQEILGPFIESLRETRQTMLTCHRSGDRAELQMHAHRLKGAGTGYGFPGLTQRAAELEAACKSADVNRIPDRLDALIGYIDQVQAN